METVALTDIIMNIFVFFFVSFSLLYTFNPERQFKIPVNLPPADTAEPEKKGPLQITIKKNGRIFMGNERIPLSQLEARLTHKLKINPDRPVLIRGDGGVAYRDIMTLLDKARSAGARRLGLAADPRGPQK